MTFKANLEINNAIAKIILAGELDANTAPLFKEQVEEALKENIQCLILQMQDLEYMASAGLRVLIFAKQKLGATVDIYLIKPQAMVRETIENTGFHHSVAIVDEEQA
ncbi:MAG TPA: anti-sigma factor antagonist [Xenococcaceae cyanobacterium]